MRPRAAGGSRRWWGTGRRPRPQAPLWEAQEAAGPGGCAWEKATSSLLPGLVSSREEDPPPRLHPCPPRLLPVRNAPSPSPAPLRARRGGRWHGGSWPCSGATSLRPLLQRLHPRACPTSGPGNPPGTGPPAPEHRSERDSAPFLQPPWMLLARPPSPVPCHPMAPPGASRPPPWLWVGGCGLGAFPAVPPGAGTVLPGFLGGSSGMCRPPGAPHVQGFRPVAGGQARGWGGLGSAWATCNHFCIN